MKAKYFSTQLKQFFISSAFVLVAVIGVSVSNSFDQDYMAKVAEHEQMTKNIAEAKEKDPNKEEDETGVALNK